jgi:hypothetical protein
MDFFFFKQDGKKALFFRHLVTNVEFYHPVILRRNKKVAMAIQLM